MLGIDQSMVPALRVGTDTPRMGMGCASIRSVSSSTSYRTWPLPRILKAWEGGEADGRGGHSGWGLQTEQRPAGMVQNKGHSESSTMTPLCWPLFLRTSKLEVAPGVGCIAAEPKPGFLSSWSRSNPPQLSVPSSQPSEAVLSFSSL